MYVPECMHVYAYIYAYIYIKIYLYINIKIYIYTHTPSYEQLQEPKISLPPKCYRRMNKRKIKNPNKAKAIGLKMVQSQNRC